MNHRNWKLVYTSCIGLEQKALELLYREMGALLLRDRGRYTIYTLRCESVQEAECTPWEQNAVVLGLYAENPIVQRLIQKQEIPPDGYLVRVMDNPERPDCQLVLITANDPAALYYGAVDWVDQILPTAAPVHGTVRLVDEVFEQPLPTGTFASAPVVKTRSVFTWGHPINDYRAYLEGMARLKLNQLILWNDYVPLNASEIVAYAHAYGIQVIWGFAWGWSRQCDRVNLDELDALAAEILNTYRSCYRELPGDGIYFQSFTELGKDRIGGRLIAEAVVSLVNTVSAAILAEQPELHIQFGLHATSVREHLTYLERVDPRVEIMWEDCGAFPFAYEPQAGSAQEVQETDALMRRILAQRPGAPVSALLKGFLTLDWVGDRFVHQAGSFPLGVSGSALIEHDRQMLAPIWRHYQTGWLQNGEEAYRMVRQLAALRPDMTLGMAGQFAGDLWFPEALCAQILWGCDRPYAEILRQVSGRRCIRMV